VRFLPLDASDGGGQQNRAEQSHARHELVPARSARNRCVVVAYRPGGLLIVEIEQPEAPRILWMERWAKR
jgi:hypothetical protein